MSNVSKFQTNNFLTNLTLLPFKLKIYFFFIFKTEENTKFKVNISVAQLTHICYSGSLEILGDPKKHLMGIQGRGLETVQDRGVGSKQGGRHAGGSCVEESGSSEDGEDKKDLNSMVRRGRCLDR